MRGISNVLSTSESSIHLLSRAEFYNDGRLLELVILLGAPLMVSTRFNYVNTNLVALTCVTLL